VRGLLSSVLLSCLLAAGLPAAARAAADDRAALAAFVARGAINSRRLEQDLARSSWGAEEIRAAVARAYGVDTAALARFVATPAGEALLRQQLPLWSGQLAPQVRLQALKAAVLADSQDGSLSLLGVLQRLPVRFVLAEAAPLPGSCGCPGACGSSSLAHLAFWIACLQAGAMGPAR
jgi:hypothetical protein